MTTPRLLSERYELGEVLGYGGMSEVHRGLDTRLGRDVAVKVLRADLARDPQFQMRFRREAQNAAALNHPAIVAVYDTGEVQSDFGPLPYIVMEYVDGQTLREIVKSTGPMTQQKVIEVMADVCAALDFSHRHQIIHRDVKPANIMINRAGAVKVMDFGIARALGEGQNVTQTAAVIGTAQYLSPEQARGEPVDARSDVYAAGCVLFELLTGEPPFTGDTPVAVAYQHVREEPRRPSDVNPSIPTALDSVVLKALSKNPANRYQSAGEMRSDLVRVRSGQSPMAPAVMSEDERTAMLHPATGQTRRMNGGRHNTPQPAAEYDEYYDEEPPRRTGRLIAIIAGVAVALGLIGFVAFQIFSGPPTAKQVAVPPLANLTADQAKAQLTLLELRYDQKDAPSEMAQKGLVVGSEPAAGTNVAERSTVTVLIGSGPAEGNVPPLVGKTVQEAEAALKDRGLELGTQTPTDTDDPTKAGRIIGSTPASGENVPGGSKVNVQVGRLADGEQVPNLKGQDENDARDALQELGFDVDTRRVASNQEEGKVEGTNPPAGSTVAKGETVTLLISDGSGGSGSGGSVPTVAGIGLTESQARSQLQSAGFTNIKTTRQSVSSQDDDGKVVAQTPDGGSTASPNQQITLFVGRASGSTIFPSN
ncbi:Stk1 family PASTA domain-containing Ser/Thr kinase [Actinomycetes bacterium KLBMP 9759]